MKSFITRFSCAFILYGAFSISAFADWSAQFSDPTQSTEQIRLELPADLDAFTLATLGVELDGIDITAMMSLDGSAFTFQPLQPLSSGEHVLRLIAMAEDGSFKEKQSWRFSIQTTAVSESSISELEQQLTSSEFRANTLTELSARVDQRNLQNLPDRLILSGSGDLSAKHKSGNWTTSARGNYLLQSEEELSVTGNQADIGEYEIQARHSGEHLNSQITMGHHSTGLNNLLISNFHRRGFSAGIEHTGNRFSGQAFAFNSSPLTGVDNFTGLSEEDENLYGSSVTVAPYGSGVDALKLTGTFYTGDRVEEGTGIGETNPTVSGNGWGLTVAKSFGEGRTLLSADFARTDFDVDASGAVPKEDGDAISLNLSHRLFDTPAFINGTPLSIDLGFSYDRIDSFYYSLANASLAADRDAYALSSTLYWGSLAANIVLLEETNNVDELQGLPTDKLRSAQLNLNYSFDQQTDSLAWLGTPYLFINAMTADLSRDQTPSGYLGNDTDSESSSFAFGGGSNYERWYWSASQTFSQYEDATNLSNDTRNSQTSINAGWTLNEYLSLTSGLQYSAFEDRDLKQVSHNTNLLLGVVASPIPNKLDLNFDYNLNLSGGSDDTEDNHVANGEIEWTFRQPRTNRSGLSLAFRFSLEDTYGNINSALNKTDYQAYLVFRVKAPFSSQQR